MYAYFVLFTIFIFIHPKWIEICFDLFSDFKKNKYVRDLKRVFSCHLIEIGFGDFMFYQKEENKGEMVAILWVDFLVIVHVP